MSESSVVTRFLPNLSLPTGYSSNYFICVGRTNGSARGQRADCIALADVTGLITEIPNELFIISDSKLSACTGNTGEVGCELNTVEIMGDEVDTTELPTE